MKLRAVGCARGRALAQNVVDRAVGPLSHHRGHQLPAQRGDYRTAHAGPGRPAALGADAACRAGAHRADGQFQCRGRGHARTTLRWQTRAANSSGDWTDIAGATGASQHRRARPADNGRQFRVTAANAASNIESPPVTVSVSDADVAPTVTTQPASIAVPAGGDAVFAIAARGTRR